jgi:hypothetical protein
VFFNIFIFVILAFEIQSRSIDNNLQISPTQEILDNICLLGNWVNGKSEYQPGLFNP